MSLDGNAKATNVIKGKVFEPHTIHGKSAYEIAVINGFEGTEAEWLASLKGADGKDGEKGEKGDKGDTPDISGFVEKVNGNTITDQVYAVGVVGQQMVIDIEDNKMYESGAYDFPRCIPRRNNNGNLYTGNPTEDFDCVNKKYVDDLVGDIDSALTELHNYAQALIGGNS